MEYYVALVHKERGSNYGVSFPDFPGCVAVAGSYEAAVEQGAAALAFHVEGLQQDGADIPAPRSFEQIRKASDDWIDFKNAIVAMVPLMAPPSEPQAISASFDKSLLSAIDRYADAASMTRSAVLAEGAKLLMTLRPRPSGLREETSTYRAKIISGGVNPGRLAEAKLVGTKLSRNAATGEFVMQRGKTGHTTVNQDANPHRSDSRRLSDSKSNPIGKKR